MTTQQNPTAGPIHEWFGLSYTNYVVLNRTFLQSMPTEFQQRIVSCFEELSEAFAHVPQPDRYQVQAATEHIVGEMTEAQLAEAFIEADWYGGETPPKELTDAELAEWRAQYEQDRPDYYRIGDGEELDPNSRVLLPAPDPVPHYDRGRTYIEPRLPKPTAEELADATAPVQLRWGLDDVEYGDDDSVTVMLSDPARKPYWLELDAERAAVLRANLAGPEEQPGPDTLPAWLYQRFAGGVPAWEFLDDGDRAYWEHHAAAVRRAVERGGFKTSAPAAVPAAETGR